MSRMNAPWANPQALSETMPEFLRSPMTVAVGASMLAHVIFFLGLPVVSGSGPSKEELRQVEVVQLTPQEMAQVPVAAGTPAIANPLPLPGSLLNPTAPKSGQTGLDLPGLSSGSILPSPQDYSFPQNSYNPPFSFNTPSSNPRPVETKPSTAPSPSTSPSTSPSASPAPSASPSPSQAPSSMPPVSPTLKVSPAPTGPTQTPPGTPSTSPTATPIAQPSPPLRLASIKENNEGREDTSSPDSLANGKGTGIRKMTWLQSQAAAIIQSQTSKFEKDVIQPLPYPTDLPMFYKYQSVIVGVTVSPEGKAIEQNALNLLQSSGYKPLTQKAMDWLKAREYPPEQRGKSLIYVINFYDPRQPAPSPQPIS